MSRRSFLLPALGRIAVGVSGGYALACAAAISVSYTLPAARDDAVLTGLLLGFAVFVAAILWTFAARTAWRAAFGLLVPALALGGFAWAVGPAGGP